ncbi:mushroom body large-type Kenyon cell-specific protein 1 isoform X2 [Orussus abietinus]|nr:mushroom body large-type Kenyon cell-specific protein 1 isoform X2 [Orussus abietinus]
MGRRRWKQYQDTLYSSTRSESATQPQQHRLYPVGLPACNQLPNQGTAGGAGGPGGPQGHRPRPPGPVPVKQETQEIQEPRETQETQEPPRVPNHVEEELRRLRPEEIKVEVGSEAAEGGRDAQTQVQGESQGGDQGENQGEDQEGAERTVAGPVALAGDPKEPAEGEDAVERRLKVTEDVDASRTVSPAREPDQPANRDRDPTNATDTEGTKGRIEEVALERIQVTAGLLRVKKEEELQEAPVTGGGSGAAEPEGSRSAETTPVGSLPLPLPLSVPLPLPLHPGRRSSPPPEDWKPLDKCYFCLDGKLPHDDQPPLSPQSDSSSSSRSAESPMSVQVDPMAASVVAAALSGTYPTLLPQWCLPPREAPLVGAQAHQDTNAVVDQPLDLSAKPKNSQDNNISLLEQQKIPLRMPAGIDPKSIFNSSYRAKPRIGGPGSVAGVAGVAGVPVVGAGGGRRTYTEEELQAALRDIQSGKLGTRRAAVIYGIPRSTLRNKVYKLAMERERDASLTSTHSHPHESGAPATTPNTTQNASATSPPPQVDEVDDKELSGTEEEKEVEKALMKPLLSLEDLVRFSALEGTGGDSLRTLLQRGQETGTEWPGFEHANIGPYIQKMLAAAAPFKGLETQDYRIPEVMRRLMSEDKRLSKDVNGDQQQHQHHHPQQQQQQGQQQQPQQQPQPPTPTQQQQQRGPMTNEDFNPSIEEEASDSAQSRAILKIPSYKPASTPGSSKNGEPSPAAFAQSFAAASSAAGSPGLLERASPAFSGTSSPTNSLVGKGVGVNFRDVIAKSISIKFQEGQGMPQAVVQSPMMSEPSPFKRGRYTPPQPTQQQMQQPPKSSQENKPKPGTGGKGTRPKRGKYRNYDRDSLVEAVRAVQRGEMSVHRAGSYYGVPHSTLEYKVKERHLMRPRKRDQKQPDDKAKEAAATVAAMRQGGPDKKPQLKPQKPFTPPGPIAGPNGLKMPPFIEGMPHLPFAHPFNFWGPTPFMPSPFMAGAPNVPTMLPEQYFATQRMRGLQEQQRNAIVQQQQQQQQRDREGINVPAEPGTSNSRNSSIAKSIREMAESQYDGTGANGNFLDNLIRSSLETGVSRDQRAIAEARGQQQTQQHHPESVNSKALIDQLCRNSRRTPLPRMAQDSSEDESYRGSGRPLLERPERVPTVDLSPSPSERGRADDGSDRLTSPPTPMSVSRTGSRDEETRDSRIDLGSREREVHNGQEDRERDRKTLTLQQQLNHYPDLHNLYAVSTDKKSACDSKLIVDHSSQKTQQQQQQQKEYAAVSGLVVQLQRGYNTGTARSGEQPQPSVPNSQPPQEHGAVLTMEDSVEQ